MFEDELYNINKNKTIILEYMERRNLMLVVFNETVCANEYEALTNCNCNILTDSNCNILADFN